jgi:hypothetical protein
MVLVETVKVTTVFVVVAVVVNGMVEKEVLVLVTVRVESSETVENRVSLVTLVPTLVSTLKKVFVKKVKVTVVPMLWRTVSVGTRTVLVLVVVAEKKVVVGMETVRVNEEMSVVLTVKVVRLVPVTGLTVVVTATDVLVLVAVTVASTLAVDTTTN